jgi:hypothetical protein
LPDALWGRQRNIAELATFAQHPLGGLQRQNVFKQVPGAPPRDRQFGLFQQRDHGGEVSDRPASVVFVGGFKLFANRFNPGLQCEAAFFSVAVQQDFLPGIFLQFAEPLDSQDKAKAVCQGRVQRPGAEIDGVMGIFTVGRRVHGRPAVAQVLQFDPLHPVFVDDGKDFVLYLGPGPGDLVKEDELGIPDGSRSLDEVQGQVALIGDRVADQVVVIQQTGVVVAEGAAQCFGNAPCQERFGTAVRADQKHRRVCSQGCEDGGIQVFQALDAQFRCEGLSHGACLLFELQNTHQEGHCEENAAN